MPHPLTVRAALPPLALGAALLLPGAWFLLAGLACRHLEREEAAAAAAPSPADQEDAFLRRWFPRGAIRTAPPDPSYNCHDWAFRGGPCPGGSREPEDYLREGGYLRT